MFSWPGTPTTLGGGLVYVNADRNWYVYDATPASANKPRAFMRVERPALDSQFTEDGRLILWTGSSLDTIIPKWGNGEQVPNALVSGTIYSADMLAPTASSASKVKSHRVILRGSQVTFPNEFNWPDGATLSIQRIPR